jgi:hypothetical protein
MRRQVWIAAVLLPLTGCYAPPGDPGYGYAQPAYPPAGYPGPEYPPGYAAGGYAPAPYESDAGIYPGYSYNGGQPTYIDGGIAVPLVLFGGEWGYYDHERHFHHAPDRISRDLETRHAGGGGQFRPNAGPRGEPNFQPRQVQPGGPAAFRPGEQPRLAPPQAAFRPGEQPRAAPPQAAFRPAEPPRAAPPPQANFRPAEQPRPLPAPAFSQPHPGFAAPPRHEEHERGRDCPPGQRC